jgi:hypothetical protein
MPEDVLRERRLRAANDANPSDGCRWMVTAVLATQAGHHALSVV